MVLTQNDYQKVDGGNDKAFGEAFTDAHTWPKREAKAMVAWVLISTLAVGYG